MIPLQLTLKNFLSYREANLDFRGLHTACICGANGAGKSSLLEAITWAVWGESRAASEDDNINAGADHARVDFVFRCNEQTYRVIRTRQRGQSSSLEFQIESANGFRSMTGRGLRVTQQMVIAHLKLDYETFINSAYLRQGRADEFMLRRPTDRKQILADLLKLEQYEVLAEQAKDLSKEFKIQADQIQQNLGNIEQQLQQQEAIASQYSTLEAQLQHLEAAQKTDQQNFQQLQSLQQQRQTWQQQLQSQQTLHQNISGESDRLTQDLNANQQEQRKLETLLSQDEQIVSGYNHYLNLQQQDEVLNAKYQDYQKAQERQRDLSQQLTQQINNTELQRAKKQIELQNLKEREQDYQDTLNKSGEVTAGLEQLNLIRHRLNQLDRLQTNVEPLINRRNQLEKDINRAYEQFNAQLTELRRRESQLNSEFSRRNPLQQEVVQVDTRLEQLNKKRVRQERVQEKEQERRDFQKRLQENQRNYEKQIGDLTHKLEMLQNKNVNCPLCDRPLDEHHWKHVVDKTEAEQQDLQGQFWVIREQLSTCERELQVLREEQDKITKELAPYDSLREQRGHLTAQLEETQQKHQQLRQIAIEKEQLERSLISGAYALELHEELQQLNAQIQRLNYDERTHALMRGEEKNWRWVEIRKSKLDDAAKHHAQIAIQKPKLQGELLALETTIHELKTSSELKQKIDAVNRYLEELGYSIETHNALRKALEQSRIWRDRYQDLQKAKQQYPQLKLRQQELNQSLQLRLDSKREIELEINQLLEKIQQFSDTSQTIKTLEFEIKHRQQQLDEARREQGKLQQQQQQLEAFKEQQVDLDVQFQECRRQYRIYHELSQAFGKNGIQTLMIENVLPQLEAETNQILARLTGNQLHVQFVTQKAGKKATKRTTKMIDTLDILIADARGTRPYETYSGGEAFRINFAIRLALARLLSQRAGTALQMLIVDEGFGTQDAEGCDRLIAAINAIASDFSCILTVTHMPQFKEAFQTRIEVYKTPQGSKISLSS